ncbi:MAG TPA: SGNH/GDSL hydrolase family protein [Vicinamibacteria bacterium]
MNVRLRFSSLALLALAAPAAAQQSALANYVALGDSLTAGVTNGSLVETHQRNSYPALIARQAGLSAFQQPTVAEPGLPAELQLVSLLPATIISPKAASPGAPNNTSLARPYNNLGVPTANTPEYATRTTDGGGAFDLVLRGLGTAPAQAVALRSAVYTLWIGNNDVLTAVVQGRAIDGTTLTPAGAFRSAYSQIVTALRSAGGNLVVATVPDVTAIPFATTIPPFVVNPATGLPVLVGGSQVPLIGPNGPLAPGTLVTLAASTLLAQGVGIPTSVGGRGTPLPGEVILDQGEVAAIQERVRVNNAAIREVAQANGATVLDLETIYAGFVQNGRTVGGINLTEEFLTGGLFSYDGIHPTELGYAILANEWIGALATAGAATLPPVDLAPFIGLADAAGTTGIGASSTGRPRGPRAEFTAEAYEQLLRLFPALDVGN